MFMYVRSQISVALYRCCFMTQSTILINYPHKYSYISEMNVLLTFNSDRKRNELTKKGSNFVVPINYGTCMSLSLC